MPILQTDYASIKGVGTVEKSFSPVATNITPRIALIGSYDNTKTAVVPDVPVKILSANDAATRFGFGTQIHRQAIYAFLAHGGAIDTYAVPVEDAVGAVAADATIAITGPATSAGTVTVFCGSKLAYDTVTIGVASGDAATKIATALAAAINAVDNLPFSAVANSADVDLTCKTKGTVGNRYVVTVDLSAGPAGVTATVTDPANGAGTPTITDALDGIFATGLWFTDIVGSEYSATNTAAALAIIGNPNEKSGWYDSLDYRPADIWFTNVAGGSAGLSAAIAIGAANDENATLVYLQAPTYEEEPSEISAYAAGKVCVQVGQNPAKDYTRLSLPFLTGPSVVADDWTKEYANRNSALVNGLALLRTDGDSVKFGDICTTWHPNDNQNTGFKYVVNQRKIWNIAKSIKDSDATSDYQDRPIVSSTSNTLNVDAIDEDVVRAKLVALCYQWQERAWIYDAGFTIANLSVTKNQANPDRFDKIVRVILSGNNRVEDTEIQVDRNTLIDATVEVA